MSKKNNGRSVEDKDLMESDFVCKTKLLLLDRMDEILELTLNSESFDEPDEETREQLLWEMEFIETWREEVLNIHEMQRKMILGVEHEDIYQLKLTLKGIKPLIWRIVEVPSTYRFSDLHEVIQELFDWSDSYFHLFDAVDKHGQGQLIRPYTPDEEDDVDYMDENYEFLFDYLTKKTRHLTYVYDADENWEVGVELKKTLPTDPEETYPVVRNGKRASPPEDSGGPDGYEQHLKAFRDRGHPQHEEAVELLEEDFDPESFDPEDYLWTEKEIIIKEEE